jgi:hypothetical protein
VVKEAATLFRRRILAPHYVWRSAGVETALFNDNFNGWRYQQGRDLAGKTTRRRIRRWDPNPRKCSECRHLSGARGVRRDLQDGFEFGLQLRLTAKKL